MADPMFSLEGKVALVTGGSRGLGRAMATAFARHGADVIVASRKQDACDAVAEEIVAQTGRVAKGFAFHAGSWDDCDRVADWAQETFGHVDVLVNNAGMSPLYPTLGQVTEDLYDKVMAVNLKGAFRLSVRVGERMAAGDGGSIINISSIAAVQPSPTDLFYGAAKAGLNAMTIGLARAFGPGVRANVIMPGPFLTDVARAWDMNTFDIEAKRSIPLQRAAQPEEIVGAALYLASDASSYTNGAVIKVDGGMAFSPA